VLAAAVIAAFLGSVAVDGVLHPTLAANPFGAPHGGAAAWVPDSGVLGWLMARQSQFYSQLSATIRAAKSDGTAVWTLLLLSFAYGIFHAAGPGHGKAVISSYLVANRESVRRGVTLSLASAMLQALVAVLIVVTLSWALNATASTMCGTERVIEFASYVMIGLLGVYLVWRKGRAFIAALRAQHPGAAQVSAAACGCGHGPHHDHGHGHCQGGCGHDAHGHDTVAPGQDAVAPGQDAVAPGQDAVAPGQDAVAPGQDAVAPGQDAVAPGQDAVAPGQDAVAPGQDAVAPGQYAHGHDGHCCHGPEPADLAGPGGWQRGAMAVLTVGIRPCSG